MQYNDRLFENRNDGRGAWSIRWLMRRYEGRPPWNFCWRNALEQTLISIAVAIPIVAFFAAMEFLTGVPALEDHPLEYEAPVIILLEVLVLAPIFETLLLQALPIMIARKCKAGLGIQVLVSGGLFAALHFLNPGSILSGLAAGVPGGLYLGFAYAYWRRAGLWTALWITTLSHAMSNLIPAVSFML